jgi:hypothetical protein
MAADVAWHCPGACIAVSEGTYRHGRSAERRVLASIHARRRVRDGKVIPSKLAVHRPPALVG